MNERDSFAKMAAICLSTWLSRISKSSDFSDEFVSGSGFDRKGSSPTGFFDDAALYQSDQIFPLFSHLGQSDVGYH
jgi:hypothetical protein